MRTRFGRKSFLGIAAAAIILAPNAVEAQLYSELVIEDAPLVYWQFDNDLRDSMGAVDLNPAASPELVEGPLGGQAFSSSGGGAWAASFGVVELMELLDFTYEFWINLSGPNEGNYILQRHGGGGDRAGENSLIYRNGGIEFINTGPGDLVDTPFVALPDETDEWVHFVLVSDFDAAAIYIYINGELAFEGESFLEPFYGGNDFEFYVGAQRQNPEAAVFNGAMDELAIYGTALSAERVAAHYAATTAEDYAAAVIADQPLTYWRFEGSYVDEMGLYNLLPSGVSFVEGPGGFPNTAILGRVTSNQAQILFDGIESYTYEFWFNPIFRSAQSYVFYRNPAGGTQHAAIYAYNPNALEFFALSGGTRPLVEIPNETDQWYYCVMTNDVSAGQFRIYIDGELVLQHDGFAAPGAGSLVVVGGSDQGDNFNGYIDEVAMYDYVLSEERIQARFNADINPVAVDMWSLY